jgi:hypothetical protein
MPAFGGPVGALLVLGAVHGINPAMGWLFAVSLGLQAQSGRAVWRALGPLALGHALAVAAAVLAAALLGVVVPPAWLRWMAAAALLGLGVYQLVRHRHTSSRRGGMTVGAKDLTVWSFIISSAHGAGLMVLPFVLGGSLHATSSGMAHAHALPSGPSAEQVGAAGLFATLLHTAAYLGVAGILAWVVYRRLGLRFLRTAWVNVNVIWAISLIVTAAVTPFL